MRHTLPRAAGAMDGVLAYDVTRRGPDHDGNVQRAQIERRPPTVVHGAMISSIESHSHHRTVIATRGSLSSKIFCEKTVDFSSYQIFEHMHRVLIIDKK
jgi:hypothetical protein